MRSVAGGIAVVVLGASWHVAAAAAAAVDQPLVGRWQWTHTATGCVENYEFRPDGTARVTSAEETLEERYEMSPNPEGRHRYRLTLNTVTDNGGRDCVGSTQDSTGKSSVGYIEFSPASDTMVFCADAVSAKCMGPLRRIGPPLP